MPLVSKNNNMEHFNFTAIDFETMTAERTSACAIGLVRVENDVIVQKFYSLIKPIPDDREKTNEFVHGITKDMVSNAPTWEELWPTISKYINRQSIVSHNHDFDIDVLDKICAYYGIDFELERVVDTFSITHCSLPDACAIAGISLEDHHDALCDATACAKIMLKCMGVSWVDHHYEKVTKEGRKKRNLSHDVKQPLLVEDVDNKDTPFFQQKVVITGVLDAYPMREDLANILKKYGADINSSISAKTNIVVVGRGAGPSKMNKIQLLRDKGIDIKVIEEPELLEIFENYHIS